MDDTDEKRSDDSVPPMKIVEHNGQYRITLPKNLVKDKKWRPGDELRFVEDLDGRIFLKNMKA